MSVIRRRHSDDSNLISESTVKNIQKFDAFPKVEEDYQKQSSSGGCVTVAIILSLSLLTFYEIAAFITSDLQYEYSLDKEFQNKVHFNVDIIIPMSCDLLGPDVLDVAGDHIKSSSVLSEQPALFKMTKAQEKWFEKRRKLRTQTGQNLYSSLNDIVRIQDVFSTPMPGMEDSDLPKSGFDSCRIFGSIPVNKVSGNFHIFIGKTISHPMGHAHLSAFIRPDKYNFSHRIINLSFGDKSSAMNALEGEIVLTEEREIIYQYFLRIVPTMFRTSKHLNTLTYQYSVTRFHRVLAKGGRDGHSGIVFRYDFDPVVVTVKEREKSFWHFIIQLCGIVGGVFATSGLLHTLISNIYNFVFRMQDK